MARLGMAAVLVATTLVALVLPATQAQALVSNNKVISWNLQGAVSYGESNWTTALAWLGTYNVAMLQEAGAVPGSSVATGRVMANSAVTDGPDTYQVVEYTHGTGTHMRYIYYVQVGATPGTRTNMAIATRQQAAAVNIIAPQGALQPAGGGAHYGRPTFGVQVADQTGAGTTWFWDVHAGAYGPTANNEAAAIVEEIGNETPLGASWAVVGDFNRDPRNGTYAMTTALAAEGLGNLRVVDTGLQTQRSGGNLDYMVTNDQTAGLRAIRTGGGMSDHVSVGFGYNISGFAYQLLSPQDDSGSCMAPVVPGGTPPPPPSSGSAVAVAACNTSAPASVYQAWYSGPDGAIHNGYTSYGYCLANSGIRPVTLQNCDASAKQQWTVNPNGTIVSQAYGYCVTDSSGAVVTLACSGAPNQNWNGYGPDLGGVSGAVGAITSQRNTGQCLFTPVSSGPIPQPAAVNTYSNSCPSGSNGGLSSRATWTLNANHTIENDEQMCLDETNGSAADGTAVTLVRCKATDLNQQWATTFDGTIISLSTGSCLTASQYAGYNPATTSFCAGAPSQFWYIPAPGGGPATPPNLGQQFLLENVDYSGYTLCAFPDNGVYLQQTQLDFAPDCLWQQSSTSANNAVWYSVGQKLVLTGGTYDGAPVWLSAYNGEDAAWQVWNLVGGQDAGGLILRPASDTTNLNLNGGASGSPATSASVTTTNWNISNHMTMAWNLMRLQPGTAPATSGSSTEPPVTPTTPIPPSLSATFLLQNSSYSGYGVCVNSSGANNVLVQQLFQSIDPDCLWQTSPGPSFSVYLYNPYTGVVLDAPNLGEGQSVDLEPYSSGDTSEQWSFTPGQDGYGGEALRPAIDTEWNLNANASGQPTTAPLTITSWNDNTKQAMSWVPTPVASDYPGAIQTVALISGNTTAGTVELCPGGNNTLQVRPTSANCTWTEVTEPGGAFAFQSTSTKTLLTYTGGIGGVALAPQDNSTDQWWTFGGTEDWGAQALRPYRNVTLNVNGGITSGDNNVSFSDVTLERWGQTIFAMNMPNTWTVRAASNPAVKMSVVSDPTNGPVTGELAPDGTAYVQEADLADSQIPVPYTGVSEIAVAADPVNGPLVAVLAGGNMYAYEGGEDGMSDASNWVLEMSGVTQIAVASDSANGPLLGYLQNGTAYVKEGGLSADWVNEYSNVSALTLASDPTNGPMIGIITNGSAYVKYGGLSADWVWEYDNVSALALATDPTNGAMIGMITNGSAYVKYGGLSADWVWEYDNVSALALATDPTNGPMIGIITNGTADVKEGGLSANWTDEDDSGVSALAIASDPANGPLVDAIQNGDDYAKEGSLTAPWI